MSVSPRETTSSAKRPSRLLWSSVLLTSIACIIAGSYFYRVYAAPYEYGNPLNRRSTRAEIAKMKEDDIARARLIREKWRPWAEAHQNLLRKMRHNRGDEVILQAFVAAVPGNTLLGSKIRPDDVMQVTNEDLGGFTFGATPPEPEELAQLNRQMFAWMPGSIKGWKETKWVTKEGKPASPPAHSEEVSKLYLNLWRKTFAETGDVELAGASSPTEPQIKFWASGRITSLQKHDGGAQGRLDTPQNNPEIEPPYDFLK